MSRNWFVRSADGEHGPLTSAELRQLAAAGKIVRDDLLSLDQVKWTPASRVKGLKFAPRPSASLNTEGRSAEVVNVQPDAAQPAAERTKQELPHFLISSPSQLLARRLVAALLDFVLFSIVFNAVGLCLLLVLVGIALLVGAQPREVTGLFLLLLFVPLFFSGAIFLQRDAGGISAKRMLGVMAVNHLGHPCNPEKSILRNLPLLLFGLPIEGIVTLLRPDRRRLGDMLGGTQTIQDYLVALNEALSQGQADRVRKIACWALKAPMSIPEANLKNRDSYLLRCCFQIVHRQLRILSVFAEADVVEHHNPAIPDLQAVLNEQLDLLKEIRSTRFRRRGVTMEAIEEFERLQRNKLDLVVRL